MHVYLIQNIVNGKIYIGQHAGDDLEMYWKHNIRAALAKRGNKLLRLQNMEAQDVRN